MEITSNMDAQVIFQILHLAVLLTIAFSIIILIFWLIMFIYCIQYQKKDRTVWMILIAFLGPPMALIYLFLKDKREIKKSIQSG
jgi:uncharacterized protein YggT (Ycf19 family)